jgi:hypothetical protein
VADDQHTRSLQESESAMSAGGSEGTGGVDPARLTLDLTRIRTRPRVICTEFPTVEGRRTHDPILGFSRRPDPRSLESRRSAGADPWI